MMKRICLGTLKYLAVIATTLFIVFPLFQIVSTSLKTPGELFSIPPTLIPKNPTFENYILAVQKNNLMRYVLNSAIVSICTTLATVVISSMAAYAVSAFEFKGKKLFVSSMYGTQIFPRIVAIIPLFITFRSMGILNSHLSLILGNLGATIPVAVILLTGYFMDIPRELSEAAFIDGCTPLGSFLRIQLPLAKPGIFAGAIYTFINVWQEFVMAISFIGDNRFYTLPVGLTTYVGQHATDWGGLMATSVVIAIPAVILFAMVKNYFIDSLAGAVKG